MAMKKATDKPAKRRRGRSAKPLPERTHVPPEEIAEKVLSRPPKGEWRYLRGENAGRD